MHAAHAPKHVRNPRCLPRLPSAHVMRIALPPRHRSSLRQSAAGALARSDLTKTRLPSTRIRRTARAFDPNDADGALL
jgi:hypothetical protein